MTTAAGRYLGWVLGIAVCGTIAVNPRASAFMLQSRVGTGAGFYRPSFAAGVSTPAGTRYVHGYVSSLESSGVLVVYSAAQCTAQSSAVTATLV